MREEPGGRRGGAYSGKVSRATSDFILKYWLKRRTAYLRVETDGQLAPGAAEANRAASWKVSVPQEVKVDAGELGLNQRPQTPEEMGRLARERKENVRKRLTSVVVKEMSFLITQHTSLVHTGKQKLH